VASANIYSSHNKAAFGENDGLWCKALDGSTATGQDGYDCQAGEEDLSLRFLRACFAGSFVYEKEG
jgi:hypothetical protein